MEKNIKDYLHLYLGCEMKNSFGDIWTLTPEYYLKWLHENHRAKPILRPLSGMTEEEMKQLYHCNYLYGNAAVISEITEAKFCYHNKNLIEIDYEVRQGSGITIGQQLVYLNKLSAKQFVYLLSKRFDLFGLIEAGFAIDKTTLKP